MAHAQVRPHHARRHRPHGLQPAPGALDRGDPRRRAGSLLANGDRLMPDPILVGRNAAKVEEVARAARDRALERRSRRGAGQSRRHAVLRCRDDADARRAAVAGDRCRQACLLREADLGQAGRRGGAGAQGEGGGGEERRGAGQAVPAGPAGSSRCCATAGFFGRMLSVRGEFGYWVFEGDWQPAQRPSWNYREADGGGIILDMLCHWRYVLDNLFGEVKAVSCLGATHIPEARGRAGQARTPPTRTMPPTPPSSSRAG